MALLLLCMGEGANIGSQRILRGVEARGHLNQRLLQLLDLSDASYRLLKPTLIL